MIALKPIQIHCVLIFDADKKHRNKKEPGDDTKSRYRISWFVRFGEKVREESYIEILSGWESLCNRQDGQYQGSHILWFHRNTIYHTIDEFSHLYRVEYRVDPIDIFKRCIRCYGFVRCDDKKYVLRIDNTSSTVSKIHTFFDVWSESFEVNNQLRAWGDGYMEIETKDELKNTIEIVASKENEITILFKD